MLDPGTTHDLERDRARLRAELAQSHHPRLLDDRIGRLRDEPSGRQLWRIRAGLFQAHALKGRDEAPISMARSNAAIVFSGA